jgi:hypothetical protein
MHFYFAWVDKTDTDFSPTEHAVEDEDVFAFSLQHDEGDFPSLEVDLRNPRVGLLSAGRKQWAWFSVDTGEEVVPLFFGRLVGLPANLTDEIVRLTFVARPLDFEEQRADLAESLRVAPYYDAVWLTDEEQRDPDSVLEGRSALWHIDRVTHEVTVSDIIEPEDGVVEFGDDEVFHSSVGVTQGQSPLAKVVVSATADWGQVGAGVIDLTQYLLQKVREVTPEDIQTIDHRTRYVEGSIPTLSGEDMLKEWPSPGDNIGGGWTVGLGTQALLIGDRPIVPTLLGNYYDYLDVQNWNEFPGSQVARWAIERLFTSHPGLVINVVDHTDPTWDFGPLGHGEVEILFAPIWRIAPTLTVQWGAQRDRREVVSFAVVADVQPLLTDPGDEEVEYLTLNADVDTFIGDRRGAQFFQTDRGRSAFEHLLARARALLLSRARAVGVQFEVPFLLGINLSCRVGASVTDPRLPGGIATGKVKHYALSLDGDDGQATCTVEIGCVVGRDGELVAEDGTPTYVEEGYVDKGYQVYDGEVILATSDDLAYTDFSAAEIDDDGLNFLNLQASDILLGLTVEGGLTHQKEAIEAAQPFASGTDTMLTVNGYSTVIRLDLRPVTGGPFESTFTPVVSELKVPKTIDLEAV